MDVKSRIEGTRVPQGFTVTEPAGPPGRLHLNYRRDVGDRVVLVHIAVPFETAADPYTWSVDELEISKEEFDGVKVAASNRKSTRSRR